MTHGQTTTAPDHTESPAPQADEQFRALMEGLRTTLPGVAVLFGFLLALPFQSLFASISPVDRILYYVAFVATAATAVLMLAPAAHQRVRATATGVPRRSISHVHAAIRLTIAATVLLLLAMTTAVYLVSRLVFADWLAVIAVTSIAGLAGWTWFVQPLAVFPRMD